MLGEAIPLLMLILMNAQGIALIGLSGITLNNLPGIATVVSLSRPKRRPLRRSLHQRLHQRPGLEHLQPVLR